MKSILLTTCLVTASFVTTITGSVLASQGVYTRERAALERRAFAANAPHGYTPQTDDCPSNPPTIRSASSLSDEETSWLDVRRKATIAPMRDLLGRLNIAGLNTDQYINSHRNNISDLPNIGIAISGGGYRAMLNGAGVIEAFDDRTPNATSNGHLGGLLQSATYLAGLSGGSWLVGSLYTNNYTSVHDILTKALDSESPGENIWQFENSIFEGPDSGGIQLFDSVGYYATIVSDADDKGDAGFNITITDYWGRALSFQMVAAKNGGPDYTFSSIAEQGWFTSGTAPMPLIVADGRAPGETIIPSNTTVYNFSPFEFGSPEYVYSLARELKAWGHADARSLVM
ncbi:Lysophospholipase 1 [Vermiconidia calcicola]|uniref:Lysophospholipase 1 n=1 Tax=Vermiconidia calcicola TaxID=1690605 RepID=A0ACC3MMD5_9PEZI|nr:Lysophospholipase 1 [Vermiconidia calcicola]